VRNIPASYSEGLGFQNSTNIQAILSEAFSWLFSESYAKAMAVENWPPSFSSVTWAARIFYGVGKKLTLELYVIHV
jgi:hypothetical protein